MRQRTPATKAALKRALAEIHPDPEIAREFIAMGIYRVRDRLSGNRCGAHARITGQPCKRKALENGRCPNHGGLSTGARTPEGIERIKAANRVRWRKWHIERALNA
jgi:hypothetical protein